MKTKYGVLLLIFKRLRITLRGLATWPGASCSPLIYLSPSIKSAPAMSAELGAMGAPAARVTSENAQDHLLSAELKGTQTLLMIFMFPIRSMCYYPFALV